MLATMAFSLACTFLFRFIWGASVMRDLTPEELKLAPEWATHYIADSDDSIIYESETLCWWAGLREPLNNKGSFGGLPNRSIKPFDITKHELFKSGILIKHKNGKDLYVRHLMWHLDKDRAIAIAKALGVTGGDLK